MTFISETLCQIVDGVKEAQQRATQARGGINPRLVGPIASDLMKHKLFVTSGGVAQFVEFDVALTATEGTGTKGGIGVVVGAIALGSSGQSRTENSASSRVKFSVPVVLPAER